MKLLYAVAFFCSFFPLSAAFSTRAVHSLSLHPSIGNPHVIQSALQCLAHVPGIGNIRSMITRFGHAHCPQGQLNNARGAVYELEVAYALACKGHTIEAFNKDIDGREFDILTHLLCVECKNMKWCNADERVKIQLAEQVRIAACNKIPYMVYSKNEITPAWKVWLLKRNIAHAVL